MTDREMLEAAAQAAGINAGWHTDYNNDSEAAHEGMWLRGDRSPDNSKYWNPLRDDGDALRLAVALRIDLQLFAAQSQDPWVRGCVDREGKAFGQQVVNGDALAATRRAIVRAAAALATAPAA